MVKRKNKLSILFIFTVMISVLFIGKVFASSNIIKLTNIQIKDQTSGVDASIDSYNANTVNTSNDYHAVNNYVEYILTILNTDSKPYSIKSISDTNTNPNIKYDYYDYKDKILKPNSTVQILIRETYNTENADLTNRSSSNSVKFLFNLVDEDGVEIYYDGDNPTTGDQIMKYVIIFGISIVALIALIFIIWKFKKGKKLMVLLLFGLLMIPGFVRAEDVEATITFNNNIDLLDKVKVTFNYNGVTRESIIQYDSSVTEPSVPNKNGYIFLGWFNNGNLFDFSTRLTSDITLEADYLKESYTITYDLDGGNASNPGVYKVTELPIALNNPVKDGYTFIGWTGSNGTTPQKDLTITNKSENLNYKANYTINTYTIAYEGLTEAEMTTLNNPDTYNIEDTITLNNPANRLDNDGDLAYRFIGWKNDTNDVSKTITITNNTGVKSYEAVWLPVAPDTYTITYELHDGTIDGTNPLTFNKLTPSFTLLNPTKRGYSFDGWIGSNGNVPQTSVTINQGTKQDLEFEAIFTKIDYPIAYDLDGGSVAVANPVTYTVTDTVTLNNPTKRGYNFLGWSGTDIEGMSTSVTIPVNSIGERSYKANYEIIEYTITYDLDGGAVTGNPTTYKVTDTINLLAPTKLGHIFTGWTGSNGQTPQTNVTITNSIGNLSYTANYEGGAYYVHFDKNDSLATGTMEDEQMQVDLSKALTSNKFYKKDYVFDGWTTNQDGTGTVYADGESVTNLVMSGTITLYAKWRPVKKAIFDTGSKVNIRMKTLSGQSGAATGTNNSIIKKVKYVDPVPQDKQITDNIISSAASQYKVYMWYDSDEKIIYYGKEDDADEIYLGKDGAYMFNYLYECTEIDTNFRTDDTQNFTQMFWRDVNLEVLDVSHFKTNEAKSFSSMFGECAKIPSFDLSGWDVSGAKTFTFMFNQCASITELDLTNWVTTSAETMKNMFSSTTNLSTLKIPNFVTSNVTDMQKMFDNMPSIQSLDLSHFDTSKVTAMNQMFENMTSLTSLNISSFNTAKVKNMEKMFKGTNQLQTLDISSFDTSIVTNMNNMFSEMSALTTIYVSSSFTTSSVTSTPVMFASDTNLVGGAGTHWSSSNTKKDYARIDRPDLSQPGYFTEKQ